MDPDRELVNRTLAGDLDAFESLVERHREAVARVAARVVGPDEAEDVSQDAFLRAFHRLDRFRGESTFQAWLTRIAHNAAINAIARKRPDPVEDPAELVAEPAPTGPKQPVDAIEQHERVRRLEGKLRTLRPEHRTVLILRDVEGLSYDEIAEVMESPVGSVKGRLHRARRELIDILRRNTYDWELPQ